MLVSKKIPLVRCDECHKYGDIFLWKSAKDTHWNGYS